MRQLIIALHLYHEEYDSFPPAFVADDKGRPMHSWRVLLLPYFEEDALYSAYNFDEPWDGPNNRKLGRQIPDRFQCPTDQGEEHTNYLAVVGSDTMWRGGEPITFDSISDEGSQTIALVEVANSGIHWMEPRDLEVTQMVPGINPPAGQGISSHHRGGANIAFADGMVRFARNDVPLDRLEAMLTVDGGETLPSGR
jgi:prepilin-type processing-associated H-X9-DG protein